MPHLTVKKKQLFYSLDAGDKPVLLMLHGNTASSRMFRPVQDIYRKRFRLLLPDFLGHGQSERLARFPDDLWFDQGRQAAELLGKLKLGPVFVLGCSGGALSALNLALEKPHLVARLVADSFEGEESLESIIGNITAERAEAKRDPVPVSYWRDSHGEDWEQIVDADTAAMVRHHARIKKFFRRDLAELHTPALLTASLQDEYAAQVGFLATYGKMLSRMRDGRMHLFATGSHPALLSNPEPFADLVFEFMLGEEPGTSGEQE